MRAISLWQPWATLVALGAKRCETRSWETSYRGPLLIHAAKTWNRLLEFTCYHDHFRDVLKSVPKRPEQNYKDVLPFGAFVAVVDLVDCVRISAETVPPCMREVEFGDYTFGRFRWDLQNVRRLDPAIPSIGRQGFYVPDAPTLERVKTRGVTW